MNIPLTLFVDTNVLVDLIARREPFVALANRVFTTAAFGDTVLWTSTSMATDAFYMLKRTSGMTSGEIQDQLTTCFFSRSKEQVHLHPTDRGDIREALFRRWDDLEDCLVDVCAERVRADYIVTRDRTGFRQSMVPAIPPERVIEILRDDFGLTYDDVDW